MQIISQLRIYILTLYLIIFASKSKAELSYFDNSKIGTREITAQAFPPHDYGDRSKLSAFILCAMLGFTGAHHFYMKRYLSGSIQLGFFLSSTVLSIFGTALFFSWLFTLVLWAWVAADLLMIIFGGLRLRKGKKLIPFEQQM